MKDEILERMPQVPLGTRMVRSALSGFVLSGLANVFLFGGQLLIARILTREDYATYAVSISFVGMVALIGDMGMTSLLVRLFAHAEEEAKTGGADRRGQLLGSGIATRLLLGVVAAVVVVAVGQLLYPVSLVSKMAILLLTFAISSRVLVLRSVGEAVLRGQGRYFLIAAFALVDAAVFAGLLALGRHYHFTLVTIFWVYSLSNLPGFVMLCVALARWAKRENIRIRVNRKQVVDLLRETVPLAIGTALLTVHIQIDTLLLDKLSTPLEVSRYGVSVRLFSAVSPLSMVIAAVVAPELARLLLRSDHTRSSRIVDVVLRLLLVLACCIALFLTVNSENVISLLLGRQYLDAGPLLALTGWILVPVFASTFLVEAAIAAGKLWYQTVWAAVLMVAVIVGDVLLIGALGAMGAMLSKLIAVMLGFAVFIWLLREEEYFDLHNFLLSFVRIAFAVATSLATLLLLRDLKFNDWLTGTIMVVVFLFAVHFVRLLRAGEIRDLVWKFRIAKTESDA